MLGSGSTLTREKDGMVMVYVPAGEFIMGSDADDVLAECQKFRNYYNCDRDLFTDEEPPHQVYLDAYYIDQYEVSNAQYQLCVETGACDPPVNIDSYSRSSYYGDSQYGNYPVIYVNWNQAQAYCEWAGATLPTEAQWEKAGRGTDGRKYPWGNSFNGSNANFCDRNCTRAWASQDYDDGYEDTAPVDAYPGGVSIYGAYNLSGNVEEWVNDWYDSSYYQKSPAENPHGPSSGSPRVLRGGSWYYSVYLLHSSSRNAGNPDDRGFTFGFRCSRDAVSP
jgi:formylglycine-generating enzyme required for sulfatase activity